MAKRCFAPLLIPANDHRSLSFRLRSKRCFEAACLHPTELSGHIFVTTYKCRLFDKARIKPAVAMSSQEQGVTLGVQIPLLCRDLGWRGIYPSLPADTFCARDSSC